MVPARRSQLDVVSKVEPSGFDTPNFLQDCPVFASLVNGRSLAIMTAIHQG